MLRKLSSVRKDILCSTQYEFLGLRVAGYTLIIEVKAYTEAGLLPISAAPVTSMHNHKSYLYTQWSSYNSMCRTVLCSLPVLWNLDFSPVSIKTEQGFPFPVPHGGLQSSVWLGTLDTLPSPSILEMVQLRFPFSLFLWSLPQKLDMVSLITAMSWEMIKFNSPRFKSTDPGIDTMTSLSIHITFNIS